MPPRRGLSPLAIFLIVLALALVGAGIYAAMAQTQSEREYQQDVDRRNGETARQIHEYCLNHPLDEVKCPNG